MNASHPFLVALSLAVLAAFSSPASARPYQHQWGWGERNAASSCCSHQRYDAKPQRAKRHAKRHRKAHRARYTRRAVRHARSHRSSRRVVQNVRTGPQTIVSTGRYIAGRLVCSLNVNLELARRGIKGTGSALAKSFLRWGRPSGPVPGAVAVYGRGRGGHVNIVRRVLPNGSVEVLNPGSRGWRVMVYRKRAIAYRVAG